jgi:hypothetical protein
MHDGQTEAPSIRCVIFFFSLCGVVRSRTFAEGDGGRLAAQRPRSGEGA